MGWGEPQLSSPAQGRLRSMASRSSSGEKALVLASLMAPNADPFYGALGEYLTDVLGRRVRSVDRVDWTVREQMLHTGKADFGFVCGLQYVQGVARAWAALDLVVPAAPGGQRYRAEPIYFSDVVVKADSP